TTAETHGFIFPNVASAAGNVWQEISDIPHDPNPLKTTPAHVGPLSGNQTGWMLWQQWATTAGGTFYWRVCWDPDPAGGTSYCGSEQTFTTPNPAGVVLPDTTIPTGPAATTTSKTADFTLHSTIANSTFECSLDNA